MDQQNFGNQRNAAGFNQGQVKYTDPKKSVNT